MAQSIFPEVGASFTPMNTAVPAGYTLRHTYTTSQSGLTFPVPVVFVVLIGGGGNGRAGTFNGSYCVNGEGGGGGGIVMAFVTAPSTITIGAATGDSNIGLLQAGGGQTGFSLVPGNCGSAPGGGYYAASGNISGGSTSPFYPWFTGGGGQAMPIPTSAMGGGASIYGGSGAGVGFFIGGGGGGGSYAYVNGASGTTTSRYTGGSQGSHVASNRGHGGGGGAGYGGNGSNGNVGVGGAGGLYGGGGGGGGGATGNNVFAGGAGAPGACLVYY